MDPIIDKLKRYAWYCETADDNADMILFLGMYNIKWNDLKAVSEKPDLLCSYGENGNFFHFNNYGKLMYFKHYHVTTDVDGVRQLMRKYDYQVEEFVTWQTLSHILQEGAISLSSYLLEVG